MWHWVRAGGDRDCPKWDLRVGLSGEPDGPILHAFLRVPQVLQALIKVLLSTDAVLLHLERP